MTRIPFRIRLLLEKLGVREWKAFQIENKLDKWEDWLLRRTINNLVVTLPETPNNEWTKVSASLDNTNVKLVSKTGIWRKTYVWQSMAKVEKE